MTRYEIDLSDASAETIKDISSDAFEVFVERVEKLQILDARRTEAWQRGVLFWYLIVTGTIILGFSVFLIIGQSLGRTYLPDAAISTLIGSVAVEFVGMLWLVVRYLFPQGRRDD